MAEGTDFCKNCFHRKDTHVFDMNGPDMCSIDGCNCREYVWGETRVTSVTGGAKGTKDARFDLIPGYPLTLLAKLYGFGAQKYAAHNWRHGYDWSKSYAAAQRHMTQFWEGEDIDEETNTPHVICAAFHMFVLAQYIKDFPDYDDRFKPESVLVETSVSENLLTVSQDEELARILWESVVREYSWEDLTRMASDPENFSRQTEQWLSTITSARTLLKAGYHKGTT